MDDCRQVRVSCALHAAVAAPAAAPVPDVPTPPSQPCSTLPTRAASFASGHVRRHACRDSLMPCSSTWARSRDDHLTAPKAPAPCAGPLQFKAHNSKSAQGIRFNLEANMTSEACSRTFGFKFPDCSAAIPRCGNILPRPFPQPQGL